MLPQPRVALRIHWMSAGRTVSRAARQAGSSTGMDCSVLVDVPLPSIHMSTAVMPQGTDTIVRLQGIQEAVSRLLPPRPTGRPACRLAQ
jgi:hypothetical protein